MFTYVTSLIIDQIYFLIDFFYYYEKTYVRWKLWHDMFCSENLRMRIYINVAYDTWEKIFTYIYK